MRPKSTSIHPSLLFLLVLAWCIPFKGMSQTSSGIDPVAFAMSNRDANTQIIPAGADRNWFNEAVAKIEDREYFIRTTDKPGTFAAFNHAQHLGYLFTEKGYTVNNFNDDGSVKGVWRTNFILEGIGRKDQLHTSPLRHASTMGDYSLQYDHNDYVVTYDNRRRGMEQSFIVKQRPAGHSELQIVLGLQGDLQATMGKRDQLLLYRAGHPQDVKLAYDNFKVWDANKKPLAAHMHLTAQHRVVMTVDDRHAVYPLTVDPFTHDPAVAINILNILGNTVDETATPSSPVLEGYSISGVGDVNGDGTDEIVIGAPLFVSIGAISLGSATLGATVTGAAFVYFGRSNNTPLTVPGKVLQPSGLAAGAMFGFSLASADLNDDGLGDIIVGAPFDLSFSPVSATVHTGNVYIFSGAALAAADIDTKPGAAATLSYGNTGSSNSALFGFSVANGGDVNGDGIDDLVVGIPGDNVGTGKVSIYHGLGGAGSSFVNTTASSSITGPVTTSLFGYSVSSAGNVNGDAYSDIVVGAPSQLITSNIASAYVFHGSAGGITAASSFDANTTIAAPTPQLGHSTMFGISVAGGDFNNDGKSDIIVGEPLYVTSGGATGRAHIYYGSASGIGTTPQTLTSPRIGSALNLLFGFSVGAANVTGDLAADAMVGEPGGAPLSLTSPLDQFNLGTAGATNVANGSAYIYKGNTAVNINTGAAPFWTFQSTGSNIPLLGASVKGVGDFNGDQFPDLAVGAPSGSLDLSLNLSNISSTGAGSTLALSAGLAPVAQQGNVYLFEGFADALPLSLLSFTASASDGDAILNWSTAQEQNVSHFGLERGTDGANFSGIAQVTAQNGNNTKTDYTYTDASPAAGVNYYRLKMVDLDGKFTYSKVVSLNFQPNGPAALSTYPNPAHGSFSLLFRNMSPGVYRMDLVSVLGRSVMSKNIRVSNAIRHNETVDLPALAPGSYWVRLLDQQNHSYLSRVEIR